jgi:hypothetical protein
LGTSGSLMAMIRDCAVTAAVQNKTQQLSGIAATGGCAARLQWLSMPAVQLAYHHKDCRRHHGMIMPRLYGWKATSA